MGTSQTDAGEQSGVQLTRNLPIGTGYGYNLYAMNGQQENYQAQVSAQNNVGTYQAGAAEQNGQRGYQTQLSGGVAMLGGNAYLTRSITNSFGVVQVPGYANVDVYAYNQYVGKTDANGNLLVPNLLPYQANTIKIEPNDLPLDAQVNTVQLTAIPYNNSGVLLRFPVTASNGATMRVLLAPNQPVPAGAEAQLSGQTETFPIVEDGRLYLTGLQAHNTVLVHWDHRSCQFQLNYSRSKDPLPDLGDQLCH